VKQTFAPLTSGARRFERLVYPKLRKRPIHEITRSDINDLLDKIEDGSGAPMANHTLAYLRRVFNWHAARVDGFHPPIVRGMARGVPNKRSRILGEDEVRALWRAALAWGSSNGDYGHPFPRLLRFTLLTATRREEAARMLWSEIDNESSCRAEYGFGVAAYTLLKHVEEKRITIGSAIFKRRFPHSFRRNRAECLVLGID
jgi:integrase